MTKKKFVKKGYKNRFKNWNVITKKQATSNQSKKLKKTPAHV